MVFAWKFVDQVYCECCLMLFGISSSGCKKGKHDQGMCERTTRGGRMFMCSSQFPKKDSIHLYL